MKKLLNWNTRQGKVVILVLGFIALLALLGAFGVIEPGAVNPIGTGGN